MIHLIADVFGMVDLACHGPDCINRNRDQQVPLKCGWVAGPCDCSTVRFQQVVGCIRRDAPKGNERR